MDGYRPKAPEPHSVVIVIRDLRWAVWMRQLISLFVLSVVPIGLGILFDSEAMQWLGFILTVTIAAALLSRDGKMMRAESIAEARAILDRMEQDNG